MGHYRGAAAVYASRAEQARAAMAGSPDATSLPAPANPASARLKASAEVFNDLGDEIEIALKEAEAAHYGRAADAASASIAEIVPHARAAADTADKVKLALDDQAKNQNETFQAIPQEGGKLLDGRPTQVKVPEKGWVEDVGLGWTWMSDYEDRQARFQATNDDKVAPPVLGALPDEEGGR